VVLSAIHVLGCGAVSPAGWGAARLAEAVREGRPLPTTELPRPGKDKPLRIRTVPPPSSRPSFFGHPRLRRSSPIAQYTVAAALEALGPEFTTQGARSHRIGIIYCAMTGCVNFSRRFCDEMFRDPATASPLVFPETVFNAPASHLASLLGGGAHYHTLVGDPGTFLQGIALAANWLETDGMDSCLILGAEERDWLVTEAFQLFDPEAILGEGAGALHLGREPRPTTGGIELGAVTRPHLFTRRQSRATAAQRARQDLPPSPDRSVLCDGQQGIPRLDQDESVVWGNWAGPRISPKRVCGEGLMAAAAWQCVAAVEALNHSDCVAADVSVVGHNQQAIAARFTRSNSRLTL
jgi:3-oxoacyl-(acyl-carrier-protein) synthase